MAEVYTAAHTGSNNYGFLYKAEENEIYLAMGTQGQVVNILANSNYINTNLTTKVAGDFYSTTQGGSSQWASSGVKLIPTRTYKSAGSSLGSYSTYQGICIVAFKN